MMTNTPSKAEIEALVKRHGATSYRNRADTQNPAYGFTPIQLAALIAEVEQAARHAPAVPVLHDAEKLRQVNFMLDRLLECADAVKEDYARSKQMMGRGLEKHCVQSAMEISHSIKQRMEDVKRLLAAAPQPPETAQLDDTNVVDMPQAVDLKEVAPVQMPEPRIYWIEATTQFCIKRGGEVPFASAWEPLYTEQQVLAILSKHGIKTK